MSKLNSQHLLTEAEGAPFREVNALASGRFLFVCEHASPRIPESLADLGLEAEARLSHAVWDPGALDLALLLSDALDAPLIAGRFSRLVWDLNRPWAAPSATPDQVETINIPGNRKLTTEERTIRYEALYRPFHDAIAGRLDASPDPPVVVTFHSFSPTWHGTFRTAEIGLLHDADDRLVQRMLAVRPPGRTKIELNEPYSAKDGVTHTLSKHGDARGLESVMIEVRNDLLASPDGCIQVATAIEHMLLRAM